MDRKTIQEAHEKFYPEYDAKFKDMKIETQCIHTGQDPDWIYGSVNVPIFATSTFELPKAGEPMGKWCYSRMNNPTKFSLERIIAQIEGGTKCLVFSSGMAAITATVELVKPGEEIISINDLYGGTQSNFRDIMIKQHGINITFFDFKDMNKFKELLNPKVKMIYLESQTNPNMTVVDIPEIVKITKEYNKEILIAVDNTFLSPYNYKPLEHGVDICVESCTKYISGHSDIILGSITTNSDKLYESLHNYQIYSGTNPSPFDCFLCIRGLKTLSLRVERQNQNGLTVAQFLSKHKNVEKVMYPGLETDPFYEKAKKQFKGCGGVVSFILKGGVEKCKQFLQKVKLFHCAVSLGSVESLAEHPATMTHQCVPPEIRKKIGIEDGLIRLSVGIENIDDLLADLTQALE
jgi:cystathionine beta-lyase/cystathionine gamma-synthase